MLRIAKGMLYYFIIRVLKRLIIIQIILFLSFEMAIGQAAPDSLTPGEKNCEQQAIGDLFRKKGKAPKNAPTYKGDVKVQDARDEKSVEVTMQKYVCNVCGYVYDPAKGDPEGNIPSGTPFEKLPDDWTCPVCGASKSEFSPE